MFGNGKCEEEIKQLTEDSENLLSQADQFIRETSNVLWRIEYQAQEMLSV